MSKIGILGGTFDPVHNTHIKMAHAAIEALKLDRVLLMPSKKPPHKYASGIADEKDRLEMLRLALEGEDRLFPSDYELKREGFTYTADTLSLLNKENPDDELFFLIGEDSLMYLDEWYKPDVIFENAKIAAFARGTITEHKLNTKIDSIKSVFPNAYIDIIPFEPDDNSSTLIREYVQEGNYEAAKTLSPESVIDCIREHGLYLTKEKTMSDKELINKLTEILI